MIRVELNLLTKTAPIEMPQLTTLHLVGGEEIGPILVVSHTLPGGEPLLITKSKSDKAIYRLDGLRRPIQVAGEFDLLLDANGELQDKTTPYLPAVNAGNILCRHAFLSLSLAQMRKNADVLRLWETAVIEQLLIASGDWREHLEITRSLWSSMGSGTDIFRRVDCALQNIVTPPRSALTRPISVDLTGYLLSIMPG